MNVRKSCFGGAMFTIGRLLRIKSIVGGELINEERFDDTFYYFGRE